MALVGVAVVVGDVAGEAARSARKKWKEGHHRGRVNPSRLAMAQNWLRGEWMTGDTEEGPEEHKSTQVHQYHSCRSDFQVGGVVFVL